MIDKTVPTPAEALADVPDGATVMIGGFGTAGLPDELTEALLAQGARDLSSSTTRPVTANTGWPHSSQPGGCAS